jgi:hypothetical protein
VKEQKKEKSEVAACGGQPPGHTAPRTACCSSLQKQTPRQNWA